jgi:hypothetical protein
MMPRHALRRLVDLHHHEVAVNSDPAAAGRA